MFKGASSPLRCVVRDAPYLMFVHRGFGSSYTVRMGDFSERSAYPTTGHVYDVTDFLDEHPGMFGVLGFH